MLCGVVGYKSLCQALGSNVDLVELETVEEYNAVEQYFYAAHVSEITHFIFIRIHLGSNKNAECTQ